MNVLTRIKNFFWPKRYSFDYDKSSPSLPESLGYSAEKYNRLVDGLLEFLPKYERIAALDAFLKSKLKTELELDLQQPNHAAILGYALCNAVVIQLSKEQQKVIEKVLGEFYPDEMTVKPTDKNSIN